MSIGHGFSFFGHGNSWKSHGKSMLKKRGHPALSDDACPTFVSLTSVSLSVMYIGPKSRT